MNIYKLDNYEVRGYDTYDSCVVVANSEEEARLIHPDSAEHIWNDSRRLWTYSDGYPCSRTWCHPKDVKVELIGVTDLYQTNQVILSSFNAG